jgi:DNA-binding MarR family transcriptional regulator
MYYNEDMNITPEQVCQDLLGLIAQMKTSLATLSEKYDLTVIQVHALYAISRGDITMGRVATTLHCDASNVTGIVDRLVSAGLITRQEGAHDRRTKTLQLTNKGRAAIDDVYSQLPRELGCARLSDTERLQLHEIVGKLTADAPTLAGS